MLDSNQSTAPGARSTNSSILASDAFWKLVAFHVDTRAAFGSTRHPGEPVPLFDQYWSTSSSTDTTTTTSALPLRGGQVVPAGAGTVYIVTGGGGQPLRPLGVSSFTAYAEAAYHVTRVTVNGRSRPTWCVDGQCVTP
jgi:hypothetical protein